MGAFAVAERMQNDDIVPNIVTANLLLESAARDQGASVLPAAQKLFNEIPTEARDKYTYPRMLHVLANFSRESEAFNCSTRLVRILLAGQTNSCSRPAFVPAHLTATSSSRSGIRMHATRASRRPVFMFRSATVKASTVVQSPTRSSASKTATHRRPIDQQYTKKSKK